LEASALSHASRRGLLARKSPLLKLQGDEKLIAMARSGNSGAFEMIVDRYQGRLLGFCRQMLGSTEDAEDVLQEVFVNAYRAMLADEREINLRPWLYRIARNRCLNHLRKPSADAQESMDMVPEVEAASTAEKVHNREEFRQIISDVNKLPETQRSALLLREMDALSYEEIADAMETTVPSVKSLLVRARISLAEASQARLLTCGEVRVELSEAAEGLRKVSAPVRRHVRECEECADFRSQVRSNEKLLAALFPVPALLAFKGFIAGKLGLSGGSAAGSAAAGSAAAGGGAAGGIGAVGGAIGTKAAVGAVAAAVLTAGAVEVKHQVDTTPSAAPPAKISHVAHQPGPTVAAAHPALPPAVEAAPVSAPEPTPVEAAPPEPAPAPELASPADDAGQSSAAVGAPTETAGDTVAVEDAAAQTGTTASGGTVVVVVGGTPEAPVEAPPSETIAPSEPPAEPPAEGAPIAPEP
jgi:RNA polymerase sigma factor (sigma-70 family)